jgi:UPF0755 protein
MTRGLASWLWIATVCAIGLVGYAGYWAVRGMLVPLAPGAAATPEALHIITIPEGATLRQFAALLEREQLVRSRRAFVLLGKLTNAERRIHAGEYALHAGMRPAEILSDVSNGRVVLHDITIPEGYTAVQIADLLHQRELTDPEEFLRLVRDRDFIRSLNLEESTLEGYLFPETYRFARHAKAKDIVRTMVGALQQALTPELLARARDLEMSTRHVLTLASLIEKETGVDAERELVSAVFHNRLRHGIPLQSDPTVIYGLAQFDGNLRKQDLDHVSPYNTYRIVGLPPSPIANPGLKSIRAALYPASARYLYFVSRNDGTHVFSVSLPEHNQNVERFQRRPAGGQKRVMSGK